MFVYLHDGRVVEVAKVTSVRVDRESIVLYADKDVAGRFNLRDVYFSTKATPSPPVPAT